MWLMGGIIGIALALLANGLVLWLGFETPWSLYKAESLRQEQRAAPLPPALGEKLSPQQQQAPDGDSTPSETPPPPEPTPTPVPDRNQIRLPLPPAKQERWPLQVLKPSFDPAPFDLNAPDPQGITALMRAAETGDLATLEQLFAQGAEINQRDDSAHTALYFAIAAKSALSVNWLLGHGATVEGSCCDGAHSLLLHALEANDLSVLEPILRAAHPREWCRPAREALYTALRAEDKPFIRALLVNHQTPPTLEDSRHPLLGYAVAWGDTHLVSLMLECGANPNTPLQSPVEKTFSRLIANASVRDYLETETGMTPLMLAAATGQLETTQNLLQYGAKRGATTRRYKMTAIDFAARRDVGPEMLQVLLGKSPRPEDQRMRINISIGSQRAVLYKDGQVALVTPISTGRPGFPTPTGQFVVTDKDRMHRSTLYPAYMPYFLRMSCRDFGLHAGELPGYPASHGCIRLPWGSAQRLFREVDIGTLVTISR